MDSESTLIGVQRKWFHDEIIRRGVLSMGADGVASNADRGNKASIAIASGIAARLMSETHERQAGQTSGSGFEVLVSEFIESTFPKLQHLRPGSWEVKQLGNKSSIRTSSFTQYEHLAYLQELTNENARLKTIIGNDYMVAPDIVVYRMPVDEDELNAPFAVADDMNARMTSLRRMNNDKPILHASISAKWTMRSDRAQNSRTEALNLIRNRKGSLPHIVVVTGEPVPSRIASLALGTGDIDCVYHFALYELVEAVEDCGREDITELLDALIAGRRLKDISDLPLDLSV